MQIYPPPLQESTPSDRIFIFRVIMRSAKRCRRASAGARLLDAEVGEGSAERIRVVILVEALERRYDLAGFVGGQPQRLNGDYLNRRNYFSLPQRVGELSLDFRHSCRHLWMLDSLMNGFGFLSTFEGIGASLFNGGC